jgi:hypothetical protein
LILDRNTARARNERISIAQGHNPVIEAVLFDGGDDDVALPREWSEGTGDAAVSRGIAIERSVPLMALCRAAPSAILPDGYSGSPSGGPELRRARSASESAPVEALACASGLSAISD